MKASFLPAVVRALRGTPLLGLLLLTGVMPLPRARAQTGGQLLPLDLTGYNADVIAEGTNTSALDSTNALLDRYYVYFATGFHSFPSNLGLPAGSNFVSFANPSATFLIPPAGANNVLLLTDQANSGSSSEVGSGTLTLSNPSSFNSLAVLVTGTDSSNPVGYTLNFADGTAIQGSFVAPDNIAGTGTVALSGFGRVAQSTGALDKSSPANTPILFEIDIALSAADAVRTLTSITFTNLAPGPYVYRGGTSERKVAVFGVSGYNPMPPTPQPIMVTGYNQDVIADAGEKVSDSTSTTLDGTYDYYAAGFNSDAPTVGLPAGTTFPSSANPDTTFALQPAAGDNALLFSQTGTLTLSALGNYTNLAVLETGFNGDVTVNYTLNFKDGGSPTIGTFIAYDNFLETEPAALAGFGRVNGVTGNVDHSVASDQPRLFEYDITLSAADAMRPLASIEFDNGSLATSQAQTVAVFGLSGVQTVPAPAIGEAAFSASGYTVARSAGQATITVNRLGGSAGVLTVAYQTQDGTAVSNVDYTTTSNTLTWAAGDTQPQTFEVPINADAATTGDVDFLVALAPVAGDANVLGSPSLTTVNILNAAAAATPIQEVDILSPPPGINVVQNQTVTLYTDVVAIQGPTVQTTFTVTDDSGAVIETLPPDASDPTTATWMPGVAGQFELNVTATVPGVQTLPSVPVPITVVADDGSIATPQVALIGGVAGRQFAVGESITLEASAVNSDGTPLTGVQFFSNSQLLGTAPVVSYASHAGNGKTRQDDSAIGAAYAKLTFPLAAGLSQLITAVGMNSSGVSAVSTGVKIVAQSSLSTELLCAIISPPDGSTLPGGDANQTVQVSATNSVGRVAAVDLMVDQREVGTDTAAPFTFILPPLASGVHVISAVATDGHALSVTANPIIVHAVVNPPTVTAELDGDGMAVEGGEKGKAFIVRTGDTSLPLTVYYHIKGSAVAGVDYKPLPGSVTIPAGASKSKVKIKPLTNETVPGIRKAKIKLVPATDGSYNLGDPAVAKIKVIDNG